jgi:hypothetical protein
MSSKKKQRLKAVSYSFQHRGKLSQTKDPDVDYVTHKRTRDKRGNPSWVETCADPLYQSLPETTTSPRKRVKAVHTESPDIQEEDLNREMFGDFVIDNEAVEQGRKTKVCLTAHSLLVIVSHQRHRHKMTS